MADQVQIYCVKCKSKTASVNLENVTLKNGRNATRGMCLACGTKTFQIGAHLA